MVSGLTTPPSCLRQATSPYTGEAILQGSQKDLRSKDFLGRIFLGPPQKSRSEFCGDLFTPSVMVSGLTTPPSCLRQATSPYTGEAILQGSPKDFSKKKNFWGEYFWGPRKNRAANFVGKGGTDVISVAFAVRRMPAKGVVFRRGAADRPRTDTPFRYRILSPARLPIPPRRHMRRPEKDGAAFYQRRLIRLRKGRERRRRLRARSRRFVRKKQALLLRVLRFRPDRAHPSRCAP